MRDKWFDEYIIQVKEANMDAAKEVLLDSIPNNSIIYKYCKGLNRDLYNLNNRELWMSNAFRFNDPYDSALVVDCGLRLNYPEDQRQQAIEDYLRQQEANKATEELQNSMFVACFSELNHSFPMWGYYAVDHKGLCIGYDLKELISQYNCMPVIYSRELVVYKENDADKNIWLSVLTKSDEWQHEREWRIVKRADDKSRGKDGIIMSNFAKPVELFIGCKQKETELANTKMKGDTDESERYADFNDIICYAERNCVNLYLPVLSRTEYKLTDRVVKLN